VSATVLGRVALVVNLSSFGNETLATFLATTLEQITTRFGSHPGTETVLAFASALGGLESPFHGSRWSGKNGYRGCLKAGRAYDTM
jgi:hypothetical protein